MQCVMLPGQKNAPLDAAGLLANIWYRFFNGLTNMANDAYVQGQATAKTVADLISGAASVAAQQKTQAQLAAFAATLTKANNGLLVEVTDYGHILRWTNPAWGWGPGETGSGMLVPFAVAPTGAGWHLCDGTPNVTYLKADGTTGMVNLPNLSGGGPTPAYLLNGPAYSGATVTAAAAPAISTPTITVTVNNATLAQAGFTAGAVVADTQAVHNHTATGVSTTPAATLPGDPVANISAPLYFRQ